MKRKLEHIIKAITTLGLSPDDTAVLFHAALREISGPMLKIDKSAVFAALKNEERTEKSNQSIYVTTALWDAFKAECLREAVGPSAVIEELLRHFLVEPPLKKS